MEKPFIHLFQADRNNYVYDVNTKVVLSVPLKIYHYLNDANIDDMTEEDIKYIDNLKAQGFLLPNRVKKQSIMQLICFRII